MHELEGRLEHPDELEDRYARAILEQAKRNAGMRPTPQAPMAAAVLVVESGTILAPAGGDSAEVGQGSEFGSTIYRQFGGRRQERGYWLLPAADNPDAATIATGDEWLNEQVEDSIR